jgi:hypothetical protein
MASRTVSTQEYLAELKASVPPVLESHRLAWSPICTQGAIHTSNVILYVYLELPPLIVNIILELLSQKNKQIENCVRLPKTRIRSFSGTILFEGERSVFYRTDYGGLFTWRGSMRVRLVDGEMYIEPRADLSRIVPNSKKVMDIQYEEIKPRLFMR